MGDSNGNDCILCLKLLQKNVRATVSRPLMVRNANSIGTRVTVSSVLKIKKML